MVIYFLGNSVYISTNVIHYMGTIRFSVDANLGSM